MAKIAHVPIAWDRSLSREQNLANGINSYWGVTTAQVSGGHIYSDMVCGVPLAYALNRALKHPNIVWLYRDANDNLKIR